MERQLRSGGVDTPAVYFQDRAVEIDPGREHRVVAADVEDDVVAVAVRVDLMKNVARLDLDPADFGGQAAERHDADAGAILRHPLEEVVCAIDRGFEVEEDRTFPEDRVAIGD